MNLYKNKKLAVIGIFSLILNIFSYLFIAGVTGKVFAAQLTEASIRLDRMGASVAASANDPILIVFKPTSTATEAQVSITWPTTNAFTVSSTDADHTATTTGIPATYQGEPLTAVPTLGSPGAETTGVVTFTVGDLTAGTLYGFYVTGGITNPSAGNAGDHTVTITTQTSAPADIDTAEVSVDTVGTDADQVEITASVPPTFNFALSGNSIALGELSTSARTTGNITVDIDTNAANGWIAWMRSEGAAATLASVASGDSISSTDTGSCVTATIGSKAYVVDVNASKGTNSANTPTVATEYGCTDNEAGGVLSTAYEQIAQTVGIAENDALTLTAVVTISSLTEAATDYTDTWEVVGAGNF